MVIRHHWFLHRCLAESSRSDTILFNLQTSINMITKSIKPKFELGTRAYIAILTICFTIIILAACSLAIYTIYQVTKHQPVTTEISTSVDNKYKGIYNISAILSPESLRKRGVPEYIIQQKRKKCFDYVKKYKALAEREEKLHGIPASIKLAQGLLESDAGESRLAKENKNHFGIKCFSRKCKKGHCSNYSDDSHKDFFLKYSNINDSYRNHSKFLQKPRYKELFKLEMNDYKGWTKGLQQTGYATDIQYSHKLSQIIKIINMTSF